MNIIHELFDSDSRKMVDQGLLRLLTEAEIHSDLYTMCLYHLRLDGDLQQPSLEYSKRLRPYLCMLFAQENEHDINMACSFACGIELIHNATLIIDDIQDGDSIRCGREALWTLMGIPKAMNCAFYLSSLGQSIIHQTQIRYSTFDFTNLIQDHFSLLISGQQEDISHRKLNIDEYIDMIDGKTGALLNLSCLLGALPFDIKEEQCAALSLLTKSFARIHQINDDLDDHIASKIDHGGVLNFISIADLDNLRRETFELLQISLTRLHDCGVIKSNKVDEIVITLSNRHNN